MTTTKLAKSRLRAIRKLMRSGPVTQAQVVEALGIHQSVVSDLLRHLVKTRQATVSHKEKNSIGRRTVLVYELTESYLATVKPNDPLETEECAQPQPAFEEIGMSITYVRRPSLWTRIKAKLFGESQDSARA